MLPPVVQYTSERSLRDEIQEGFRDLGRDLRSLTIRVERAGNRSPGQLPPRGSRPRAARPSGPSQRRACFLCGAGRPLEGSLPQGAAQKGMGRTQGPMDRPHPRTAKCCQDRCHHDRSRPAGGCGNQAGAQGWVEFGWRPAYYVHSRAGRLPDKSGPSGAMRGSNHARGIKAWAMNPEPKALGQKRSGPAGASVERLPADRRVQSGRWAWGRGTLRLVEVPSRRYLTNEGEGPPKPLSVCHPPCMGWGSSMDQWSGRCPSRPPARGKPVWSRGTARS